MKEELADSTLPNIFPEGAFGAVEIISWHECVHVLVDLLVGWGVVQQVGVGITEAARCQFNHRLSHAHIDA